MSIIIRNREGAPSRYTLALGPTDLFPRYERTYTVRAHTSRVWSHDPARDLASALEPVPVTATYTVRDTYPRPTIISRDPETAPELPAYVLDRVRMEDARDGLRERINLGDTIYLVRRTPMGPSTAHLIDLFHVERGEVYCISHAAALAAGLTYRSDCIYMSGGGMDLGFAAVDALGYALFGVESALAHRWL